jgi:hypothetical protein
MDQIASQLGIGKGTAQRAFDSLPKTYLHSQPTDSRFTGLTPDETGRDERPAIRCFWEASGSIRTTAKHWAVSRGVVRLLVPAKGTTQRAEE